MTVEQELTIRHFEDLRELAAKTQDFDLVCRQLGINMRLDVYRKAAVKAYDRSVLRWELMAIELIPLQDKNDLKDMAKRYCNSIDYCKVLWMFIQYMDGEKQD